jgi:hypothetical protein
MWFVVALAVPIIHQIYVWLIWRGELCFGAVSRSFGDRGFLLYQAVFVVLLLARPVTVALLAISACETVEIPIVARIATAVFLLIPAIYTLYSVARYSGMSRACGIDHFDPSYRNLPMVREGIFRFDCWAQTGLGVAKSAITHMRIKFNWNFIDVTREGGRTPSLSRGTSALALPLSASA